MLLPEPGRTAHLDAIPGKDEVENHGHIPRICQLARLIDVGRGDGRSTV